MKVTRGFALKQEDASGKHEGSPFSFRKEDPRLLFSSDPAVLMWAEDYDAMIKEVEEYRALKERTKNAWTEAIRKIREGAKK